MRWETRCGENFIHPTKIFSKQNGGHVLVEATITFVKLVLRKFHSKGQLELLPQNRYQTLQVVSQLNLHCMDRYTVSRVFWVKSETVEDDVRQELLTRGRFHQQV